jgi:hypothetical protein
MTDFAPPPASDATQNARVSRTVTLAKVDGRSALGRLMRQVRAALIRHVGGRPSATQKMMIERAVTLTGYLARLDAEALSPAGLSDHRRREYLAADGSLRRTLREIGLKGAAATPPSLADYLASRAKPDPGATAA